MADPLSQLRQFHIGGREIKEHNGYIIFGDHGWPKNVNTNYQIYSTDDDKNKKEYYTLECLLYFLKNMDVAHTHYVKQAGRDNIPVVHRPDRKNLLAYLKGEQQTASSIDKNAPIPPLRQPAAEIYKKDHQTSIDPQPSTSSQSSSSQHDSQRAADVSGPSAAKKRHHDPQEEMRLREDLRARLSEQGNKKMATIIPTEAIEKPSAQASAAISKFGAEKLAAMRAKHLAVKRTTIIDADSEVGKPGSGSADASRKDDVLYAVDSDKYQLIKSKEKPWRTRHTILQAPSKNFATTVLPMVESIYRGDDPKKPPSKPAIPMDVQMFPQSQQQQQQLQQQQQQAAQRNSYNRYDQERFVKLDIGVEIDTKKSFVSGVANGLPNYSQQTSQAATPTSRSTGVNGSQSIGRDSVDHHGRPSATSRTPSSGQKLKKRSSTIPIIIIPATTTSLINMYNAQAILQDLTYVEGKPGSKQRESELLIQRKKSDGTHAAYKIIDNPVKLDPDDWHRVVAVFVQGPAWQFKGWPWGGSPVEIFSHIKGFHMKWDESKLDDNVAKWNVHVLDLSRTKRHLDKANLLKFWSSLDNFMIRYKSFLKI